MVGDVGDVGGGGGRRSIVCSCVYCSWWCPLPVLRCSAERGGWWPDQGYRQGVGRPRHERSRVLERRETATVDPRRGGRRTSTNT